MTIYDFHAMDEMEQAEAVWSDVRIGEHEDEDDKVLYSLEVSGRRYKQSKSRW